VTGLAAVLLAVLLALLAARSGAATAYVSDELVLGVYAEQNNQGQRLGTLHSGASVETLNVNGEYTEVRLSDGTSGWVKSAYLTSQVPATLRVKQLEEELDRSRATTPALAEAAARSEVEQLQRELAGMQAELDAARGPSAVSAAAGAAPDTAKPGAGTPGMAAPGGTLARGTLAGMSAAAAMHPWIWGVAMLAALACGFWLGYATLARRVKQKFGGIKVY
jgi:SH3 domain-containing protein